MLHRLPHVRSRPATIFDKESRSRASVARGPDLAEGVESALGAVMDKVVQLVEAVVA